MARNQHIYEQLLEEMKHIDAQTWQQRLFELIDKKGFTDVEVYQRAQINKQLFSDIRSNPHYLPQKGTAIALSVALELNLEETKDLLARAGYTLSASDRKDVIVKYYIEQQNYSVNLIDMILHWFNLPILSRQRIQRVKQTKKGKQNEC